MIDYQSELNPSQCNAVLYTDGDCMVIAGAGSGKTRVLTYRIAHLLEEGVDPWSILALTFTNKAAGEMKQRIAMKVGENRAKYLWMGTFHSIFSRILRSESERIGYSSNFTIYDQTDSQNLIKSIIKEMQLDDKTYKPSVVQNRISNAKNRLMTASAYIQNADCYKFDQFKRIPMVGKIFERYEQRCRHSDAMDFDDLLLNTFILFRDNPDVMERYGTSFKHILVDEYQDTNYAQHCIVWQLTRHGAKVCVVGDDAQSIYSFRGANLDNMLKFSKLYPDSRLFKLEQNYRSTQVIVEAAGSLICKNHAQIKKNVFSENEQGDKIKVLCAHSDLEESEMAVNRLLDLHTFKDVPWREMAVLYRTNAQSRPLEEALRKRGLPYKIYGGLSFYQRKEIKDLIAYFRMCVNPNDEEAFKRVINYPARGIGQTTVAKILATATQHEVSLWSIINNPEQYGLGVNKGTLTKIGSFREMIESFIENVHKMPANQIGTMIVKQSGIIAEIYQDTTPENLSRQENVEELMNGMQDFCDMRMEEGNENISLTDYLSEVSLMSDVDSDKGDDEHKVTLMTIHSAKGLEFGTVFVVGLEEGLFPSDMVSGNPREMEEERRLFYVAITRAKTHCYLSYAQCRFRYGQMEFSSPSRFLKDIDSRYLDRQQSMFSSRRSYDDDVQLPWQRRGSLFGGGDKQEKARPFRPTMQPKPISPIRQGSRSPSPQLSTLNSQSSAPNSLSVGTRILHNRFGRGEILRIEGTGDSTKATVQFENVGTKQLLLKFAKFEIL